MNRRRWAIVALLCSPLVYLAGCGSPSASADQPPNTDPRKGWVLIEGVRDGDTDIEKRCDGSTLLYRSHVHYGWAPAVVPNSAECMP